MNYKGIIFDFNGVLLWDSPIHEKAWNTMSIELRGKSLTQDEINHHVHGRMSKDTLEYLAGRQLSKEEADALELKKENMYIQNCLENFAEYHLSEGAEDLLDFVVTNNIPHTIATAAPKLLLDFYEKHLHLSKWFALDKIVYNDATFPGKPAPDIYRKAADIIGLDPKDCIVIEDAHSGIKAAHAAGIGFIIGLGPEEKHETLKKLEGVDQVITTMREVKKELFTF